MRFQRFNASNAPGTCKWCGRKLRRPRKDARRSERREDGGIEYKVIPLAQREFRYSKPGDYGDGHFCGLSCGYLFGVVMADNGRKLLPAVQG